MTQPEIIYEDEDILVCRKPAGIATQTKRLGQKDMESILKNYIAVNNRKAGRTQPPYIGIVHRLDQPVEGVMVYAKTPQAAAKLSEQVKKRFKTLLCARAASRGKTIHGRNWIRRKGNVGERDCF